MSLKKRSSTEWRALVADCESSDMTQRDWCIANNVNFYTFADRARRLRRLDEEGSDGPMFRQKEGSGWVEIKGQIPETGNQAPIESPTDERYPGEIRVMVGAYTVSVADDFNEAAFVRVLTALTGIVTMRGMA